MTFFIALGAINGIVYVVRGYPKPPRPERTPWAPPTPMSAPSWEVPTSTYPSGFEAHAYHPTLTSLDSPSPFKTLGEARAFADKMIPRGYQVAIRYVPPGYVPNDPRSEASTAIVFAQPPDYNPWRPKSSSPRERA